MCPSIFLNKQKKENIENIEALIEEYKSTIRRFEVSGKKFEASIERLKVGVKLANLYVKHQRSRYRDEILKHLIAWFKEEIPSINPECFKVVKEGENNVELVGHIREPKRTIDELEGKIKEELNFIVHSIILALEHPNLPIFDEYSNLGNFLFIGVPGTGKTHAAEGIAMALRDLGYNFKFIVVTGADIKSHLYGKSQKNLESLLRWADSIGPSIVFIDEFDEIATRDDHEATAAITNTLLSLTDGPAAIRNVVIIGATNKPEKIDSAIFSRFTTIFFEEPDIKTKVRILERFFNGYARFNLATIKNLLTDLSGRDLKMVVRHAFTLAAIENGGSNLTIRLNHVLKAINIVKSQKKMRNYDFTKCKKYATRPTESEYTIVRYK